MQTGYVRLSPYGLVHTGDKIDFESVDFVEVDWIDQTVDEIDQSWTCSTLVDSVDRAVDWIDWVASSWISINHRLRRLSLIFELLTTCVSVTAYSASSVYYFHGYMCILMYIGNYIIYCIGIYLFYFLIMESDSWTDARTLKQQRNSIVHAAATTTSDIISFPAYF